jgi:signal transduction histidine kinase
MTIRQKLRLSILLLGVAFVVSASTVAYVFHTVHRKTVYMAGVNHIIRLVFELSLLGYEYQMYREERAAVQWQGIHRRLGQELEKLTANMAAPEDYAVLQRMDNTHVLLSTLFVKLAAQKTETEAVRLVGQSLLLRSNVLVADAHQLAAASNRAIVTRVDVLLFILMGSLVPLLGACVFVGMAHRRILLSLAALHEGTARIGQGHLTHKLLMPGHDEFTALAGTLNAMAEQLHIDSMQRQHTQDQLQQSIEALTRSNADLEQFAYAASHDLQEPVRAVVMCLQLFQADYTGKLEARADELIRHAVEGGARMRMLVDDLLAYARVSTRGTPLVPTDCTVVVTQVLDNLKVALEESGAVVTHDPLPRVLADATQLLQVFQNLLRNALKFRGAAPPTIHISVASQENAWLFAVRDNGIGIEPQYAERIFVIFQRLYTRREYAGTGMGLALCKKIVERHGGRIWVESALGQGATFFFTLPHVKEHSRNLALHAPISPLPPGEGVG